MSKRSVYWGSGNDPLKKKDLSKDPTFAAWQREKAKEGKPPTFRTKTKAVSFLTRKQWREVDHLIFERAGRRKEIKQVTRNNWHILNVEV